MKTVEERKAILDKKIYTEIKEGWQITSRTDTSCQLIREKKPNGFLTIILFLFFILPCIVYLLWVRGNDTIYVEVDEGGTLHTFEPD
jgi:hypothetical protein